MRAGSRPVTSADAAGVRSDAPAAVVPADPAPRCGGVAEDAGRAASSPAGSVPAGATRQESESRPLRSTWRSKGTVANGTTDSSSPTTPVDTGQRRSVQTTTVATQ